MLLFQVYRFGLRKHHGIWFVVTFAISAAMAYVHGLPQAYIEIHSHTQLSSDVFARELLYGVQHGIWSSKLHHITQKGCIHVGGELQRRYYRGHWSWLVRVICLEHLPVRMHVIMRTQEVGSRKQEVDWVNIVVCVGSEFQEYQEDCVLVSRFL